MKIEYKILYKSGHEDTIIIDLDSEEVAEGLANISEIVEEAMREGCSAVIMIGDEKAVGSIINVADITRMKTTVIQGETK